MQTKELEPCPFCGGEARKFETDTGWRVECDNDVSCNVEATVWLPDEAEAITAWNTRLPTSSGGRGEAWRTVPVEPTEAMRVAGCHAANPGWTPSGIYTAMIAAAPLPASPSQERCGELGSVGLQAAPVSPSPTLADEAATPSWHERLKWLVEAGDYPAALALLRAPKAGGPAHFDLNAWANPFLGWPHPAQHDYWRPGNPDCPADIKAGNGELHTLRCKRCGLDDPRNPVCAWPVPDGVRG